MPNFPNNPSIGDRFSFDNKIYEFDGSKWKVIEEVLEGPSSGLLETRLGKKVSFWFGDDEEYVDLKYDGRDVLHFFNLKQQKYALDFNGTSNRVDLPNYGDVYNNGFTVGIKANPNTTSNGYIFVLYGDENFRIETANEKFNVRGSIGSFTDVVTSGNFNTNQWYDIKFVYENSGEYKLYLDGVLVDSISGIGTFDNRSDGNFLGTYQSDYFEGQITDVQVWSKALTQQEIENNLGKILTGNEQGLVAYYAFVDESGQGTTLIDRAGNNNGTIVGATWVLFNE